MSFWTLCCFGEISGCSLPAIRVYVTGFRGLVSFASQPRGEILLGDRVELKRTYNRYFRPMSYEKPISTDEDACG